MMSAFKAYDIRGVYGRDFTAADVERIGFFLPKLLKTDRVLVGRDVRVSSPEIFEALTRGITAAGADAVSIGLSPTPMLYYTAATRGFDAAVQITASHNPPEYNGLKICKTGAQPVDYADGLADLERMCATEPAVPAARPGRIEQLDIRREYIRFFEPWKEGLAGLDIGVDCSNGMAALLIRDVLGPAARCINDVPDGTFPGHDPNPLIEANCEDLKTLVRTNGLDIGVIFDGDADRVMFTDEQGRYVQPDLITAVLAEHYLQKEKGIILHDIRTSRAVTERIRELGGEPYMWKVGHSFAKRKMRELGAIAGGELAGHYYFRDFFCCDSGLFTALIVLRIAARLKAEGKPFSSCIAGLQRYANSGEINFRIADKAGAVAALRKRFADSPAPTAVHDFDGVRIEFDDWWFNVRPSNTEPWLRLVIEARDADLLDAKRAAIEAVLNRFA